MPDGSLPGGLRTHGIIDILTKTFAPDPLVVDSALKPAMFGGNGVESLDPEGAVIIDAVDNELKLRGYSPKICVLIL